MALEAHPHYWPKPPQNICVLGHPSDLGIGPKGLEPKKGGQALPWVGFISRKVLGALGAAGADHRRDRSSLSSCSLRCRPSSVSGSVICLHSGVQTLGGVPPGKKQVRLPTQDVLKPFQDFPKLLKIFSIRFKTFSEKETVSIVFKFKKFGPVFKKFGPVFAPPKLAPPSANK